MRILIIIKGGSSSVEGDVPQGSLEEFKKSLNAEKSDFIILNDPLKGQVIVNKSSIGYITRKR